MTAKIDGTNGLLQQYDYQASTTGFSYTFAAGTTVLVMNPAGTLATGTITMPASPADGMTISFSSTQIITALTVNANAGQSIVGNPTTLLAGGAATFVYRLSNTTWYAQASTAAIGNTGAGAPIVTIYTSTSPWTKPATLKAVKVTVVAGGGGANFSPTGTGPGGGGAAGYLFLQAPSIPGPVTVTVGTGGTAVPGPGATAPSGTPSSFGALATATGGAGVTAGVGGLGGSMSTTPTIFASRGQTGNNNVGGGNAGFGLGLGALAPVTTALQNGVGYGFGGRGFQSASNPGICAGGAGIVVVEEFY